MRVGIIGFTNLYGMPYLNIYTSLFKKMNIDYDVIYWNRDGQTEQSSFNVYIYDKPMEVNCSTRAKILNYMKFTSFVKKVVKKEKYDFLIILTTVPAVFLSLFLRNYAGRYVVDIRDYSYEHIRLFKGLMDFALKNSLFNVISSPGFMELVKNEVKSKTYLCHNISFDLTKPNTNNRKLSIDKTKLVIGFVGAVRYYDECVKLIDEIKNDSRYDFKFYGSGVVRDKLELYCKKNFINNVYFFGKFTPSQKPDIYSGIDIIYNLYGNKTKGVELALSNRFYDAAWYDKPLLVNEKTLMSRYSTGISYVVEDNESQLANKLWNWYFAIDWEEFYQRSGQIIDNALFDNKVMEDKLLNSILKENKT